MSEPQMMAACPKYNAKGGVCVILDRKCIHAADHEYHDGCAVHGSCGYVCTPLAAPATQPPRLSARERIEREVDRSLDARRIAITSGQPVTTTRTGDLVALAAERVIAACDAECDALRETLHSERERLLAKNTENVAWWREEVETKIRYGIKMETQLRAENDALRERLKMYVNAWEPGGNPWEQRQRAEAAEKQTEIQAESLRVATEEVDRLRATVERLQHEADRTVESALQRRDAEWAAKVRLVEDELRKADLLCGTLRAERNHTQGENDALRKKLEAEELYVPQDCMECAEYPRNKALVAYTARLDEAFRAAKSRPEMSVTRNDGFFFVYKADAYALAEAAAELAAIDSHIKKTKEE